MSVDALVELYTDALTGSRARPAHTREEAA